MIDQWYYSVQGRQHGPVPFETLRQLAMSGVLTGDAHVRNTEMREWRLWSSFTSPPERSMEGDPLEQLAQATRVVRGSAKVNRRQSKGVAGWLVGIVVVVIASAGTYWAIRPKPVPDKPVVGKSTSPDKPVVTDPKASFEQVCRRLLTKLSGEEILVEGKRTRVFASPEYSIDVRRTDSLVSPYMGTLMITVNIDLIESEPINDLKGVKYKLTLAQQEGRWILQNVEPQEPPGGFSIKHIGSIFRIGPKALRHRARIT